MTDSLVSTRFRVEGMDCASCAAKIDTAVRRLTGVSDVTVSVTAGTMTVQHDGSFKPLVLEKQVAGLGYRATPASGNRVATDKALKDHNGNHDHAGHDHARQQVKKPADAAEGLHGHDQALSSSAWWQSSKGRLTIACGLAVVAAFAVGKLAPSISPYAFIAAILVGLVPIARRAFMAAMSGTPFSIEMLMTIAAVGAVFINAAEEAAAVVFLFLVGELLEGVAAGKARASIQSLTTLVPKTAFLEENGQSREVPADSLVVGNVILVRPGDRMPADGEIIDGEGAINEAPVTGESTPVRKGKNAKVYAGTINGESVLRVHVSAAASDNTIARIVRLVEDVQESKAPTERFIDRFSKYYTPGVVIVGALVAIVPPLMFGGVWSEWIYKGLAILLIGCPCALVISTPAAIAASLSSGARRGLLLKGGAVLEQLGKINAVAFDKTGTLTEGKPVVTDVRGFGYSESDVIRLAAALETGSSHPLAIAILAKAAQNKVTVSPASNAKAIGGKGVEGTADGIELFLGSVQSASDRAKLPDSLVGHVAAFYDEGKTISVLLANRNLAGVIAMRDEPRPDAIAGLKALNGLGVRTVMLTGDHARTANAIGKSLGMDDIRADLMPEDKQRIVGELQAKGLVVAKIGDGINDAPALAAANVGISMGGGTDVALETADAAILHGRVSDVAEMIILSKRTMANIAQNLTIALGLKAVFLVTTVIGVTGLWPAILADTGATVLVTMNALRLLAVPKAL